MRNLAYEVCAKPSTQRDQSPFETSLASLKVTRMVLFFESGSEIFALLLQLLRHNAAERVEKPFVRGEFLLPLLVIDSKKLCDANVIDVETINIEIMGSG